MVLTSQKFKSLSTFWLAIGHMRLFMLALIMLIFMGVDVMAQASGTGRYPTPGNESRYGDMGNTNHNQHVRSTPVRQDEPQNDPTQNNAEELQIQRTAESPRRLERRIGLGVSCSFESEADTCDDDLQAQLTATYNNSTKIDGIQLDIGATGTYGMAVNGSDDDTSTASTTSSSFNTSLSAIYAASPKDQLQVFSNLSYSEDEAASPTDGTVFDSEDTLLYGLGIGYHRAINGVNVNSRLTYGSSSGAEDVTSFSLSGIARDNAGSYNEFVASVGASMDISKTESIYAEIGHNNRSFNRTGTRDDADSSGWTGAIGAVTHFKKGTKLQAEIGYRAQNTENDVAVSGWTAAANFEQRLSKKMLYNLYIASDREESEDLTSEGSRLITFGGNIDNQISRKARVTFGSAMKLSTDMSDETTDQTLELTLDYLYELRRNVEFRAGTGWSQAILNAGEETETATNEFSLSTGIDWKF